MHRSKTHWKTVQFSCKNLLSEAVGESQHVAVDHSACESNVILDNLYLKRSQSPDV